MARPRFAGEALQGVREQPLEVKFSDNKKLNNPEIGLIQEPSSIRARQTPGGDFEPTQTEKQLS